MANVLIISDTTRKVGKIPAQSVLQPISNLQAKDAWKHKPVIPLLEKRKSKKKHQLFDKVQRIHGEGLTKFLNNKKILNR